MKKYGINKSHLLKNNEYISEGNFLHLFSKYNVLINLKVSSISKEEKDMLNADMINGILIQGNP